MLGEWNLVDIKQYDMEFQLSQIYAQIGAFGNFLIFDQIKPSSDLLLRVKGKPQMTTVSFNYPYVYL